MIRFLLNTSIIRYFLILPYLFLIRSHSLLYPEIKSNDLTAHPILGPIADTIPDLFLSIIAIFLVFIQSRIVILISNKNRLNSKPSLISGLLYATLISILPVFLPLSPLLISLTFILLVIYIATDTYKKYKPIKNIFYVGFLSACVLLVEPRLLVFLLISIISIAKLHRWSIEAVVQYLGGIIVPMFLLYTGVYFFKATEVYSFYIESIQFKIPFLNVELDELVVTIIFAVIGFLFLIMGGKFKGKKAIQAQKTVDILFYFFLFLIVTSFFWGESSLILFMLLCIPFALFFNMLIIMTKRFGLAEILHFIIIVVLLGLHYQII